MDSQRFNNKVVLVTGGSSGMGFASAKLFADEGADVVITGRNLEKLESAAEKIDSEKVLSVQGDVGDMNHLDNLAQKIHDTFGKLDILFANAG
ncbi:short chain dehydrogenase [Fodinibius roseus]|uniref:Short chain dehydrogenase n=1 Tax=Fodinibius roseus TaxID=1194090 RepID=A0A1M4YZ06_9BACT|nr:SDR family NAD(P)-dependent oxidoreductase [Fodinibius roseus]SHF10945.1 short chain dehydrogenase [Fodinibius roseus]